MRLAPVSPRDFPLPPEGQVWALVEVVYVDEYTRRGGGAGVYGEVLGPYQFLGGDRWIDGRETVKVYALRPL